MNHTFSIYSLSKDKAKETKNYKAYESLLEKQSFCYAGFCDGKIVYFSNNPKINFNTAWKAVDSVIADKDKGSEVSLFLKDVVYVRWG